jgi:5-formyltetrahydrofolate cyclo-ligase
MEKQELRERIWDELEDRGKARFPFPPHGRIPNFEGAKDAAERLANLEAWQDADVIKSNPDSPQLSVRRRALRAEKVVYMAVPRLADQKCFLQLDPEEIDDIDDATTVSGSSEHGVRVGPESMDTVDFIVSGSVGVNEQGERIGKGEGYSDLEFGILREFGMVDDDTTTVTTVHEIQLVDDEIPTTPRDVPIDWIFTPEETVRTKSPDKKPEGISWKYLDDERIDEIPILAQLNPK